MAAEFIKKKATELFAEQLEKEFSSKDFVVFLCGPTLKDLTLPGAKLRKQLKEQFEGEGFDVVLGEDDGLEEPRLKFDLYAHENELRFIENHCGAVVLVATSVGAFCELGLFSYKKSHDVNHPDIILIVDEKYKDDKSYFNEGPAAAVEDHGKVFFGNLDDFDISPIIKRLRRRRTVYSTDKIGRPPGKMV
ncbi:MAG: hypothetical protein ED859_14280 [Desulfuromonadales bacterium]|nr:MAG: hypothetical protein ED859_14280 [Desulfuromonadales bacterium]